MDSLLLSKGDFVYKYVLHNLSNPIKITPKMTVMARLFVRKANNRVGTIAMSVSQFTPIESLLLSMALSTTRAVRIQIGIKESHLSTGAGNCKLRTTKMAEYAELLLQMYNRV